MARQKLIHDRAGDRSIWFSITLDGCRGAPKQLDSETTRSTANANPAKSVDASIAGVRDAIARGELLQAFDLAERALEDFPANPVLQYNAVLALARAGATQQARGRYDRFKLGEIVRSQGDDLFLNDIAALDARIAKDEALEATGRRREARLVRAATLYEAIFKRTVDYYPGINAATLSLLSGQPREAESLARQVLKLCAGRAGLTTTMRSHRRLRRTWSWATLMPRGLLLALPLRPPAATTQRSRLLAASFGVFAKRGRFRLILSNRSLLPQ